MRRKGILIALLLVSMVFLPVHAEQAEPFQNDGKASQGKHLIFLLGNHNYIFNDHPQNRQMLLDAVNALAWTYAGEDTDATVYFLADRSGVPLAFPLDTADACVAFSGALEAVGAKGGFGAGTEVEILDTVLRAAGEQMLRYPPKDSVQVYYITSRQIPDLSQADGREVFQLGFERTGASFDYFGLPVMETGALTDQAAGLLDPLGLPPQNTSVQHFTDAPALWDWLQSKEDLRYQPFAEGVSWSQNALTATFHVYQPQAENVLLRIAGLEQGMLRAQDTVLTLGRAEAAEEAQQLPYAVIGNALLARTGVLGEGAYMLRLSSPLLQEGMPGAVEASYMLQGQPVSLALVNDPEDALVPRGQERVYEFALDPPDAAVSPELWALTANITGADGVSVGTQSPLYDAQTKTWKLTLSIAEPGAYTVAVSAWSGKLQLAVEAMPLQTEIGNAGPQLAGSENALFSGLYNNPFDPLPFEVEEPLSPFFTVTEGDTLTYRLYAEKPEPNGDGTSAAEAGLSVVSPDNNAAATVDEGLFRLRVGNGVTGLARQTFWVVAFDQYGAASSPLQVDVDLTDVDAILRGITLHEAGDVAGQPYVIGEAARVTLRLDADSARRLEEAGLLQKALDALRVTFTATATEAAADTATLAYEAVLEQDAFVATIPVGGSKGSIALGCEAFLQIGSEAPIAVPVAFSRQMGDGVSAVTLDVTNEPPHLVDGVGDERIPVEIGGFLKPHTARETMARTVDLLALFADDEDEALTYTVDITSGQPTDAYTVMIGDKVLQLPAVLTLAEDGIDGALPLRFAVGDAGRYTFAFEAMDGDGQKSAPVNLTFDVVSLFHRSLLIIGLCVGIVLLLACAILLVLRLTKPRFSGVYIRVALLDSRDKHRARLQMQEVPPVPLDALGKKPFTLAKAMLWFAVPPLPWLSYDCAEGISFHPCRPGKDGYMAALLRVRPSGDGAGELLVNGLPLQRARKLPLKLDTLCVLSCAHEENESLCVELTRAKGTVDLGL